MKHLPSFENYDNRNAAFDLFVYPLNPEDRHDWIRGLGKANHLWHGSDLGLFFADQWSQEATNYVGIDDVEYHYRSLGSKKKARRSCASTTTDTNQLALRLYSTAKEADARHPYLVAHDAKPHGIKQKGGSLYIPIRSLGGIADVPANHLTGQAEKIPRWGGNQRWFFSN